MLLIEVSIFGIMLIAMLTRVFLPLGKKPEGNTVKVVTLSLRYRLLYHRNSIYFMGIAMVLGSIGGWLDRPIEIIVILLTFTIATRKINYTFTDQGVSLNNILFRRWSEFASYSFDKRYLRLSAKKGVRDFRITFPDQSDQSVLKLLKKRIGARPEIIDTAETKKVPGDSFRKRISLNLKGTGPSKKHS